MNRIASLVGDLSQGQIIAWIPPICDVCPGNHLCRRLAPVLICQLVCGHFVRCGPAPGRGLEENEVVEPPPNLDAIDSLPDTMRLGTYIDVQSLLDLLEAQAPQDQAARDRLDIAALRPIQSMTSGRSSLKDNLVHGVLLLVIEQ